MSDTRALHEAVARAIADARNGRALPTVWFSSVLDEELAAAAIRVVLAETTHCIEALRNEPHTTPPCRRAHDADDAYGRALAVLAALGEQA